MDALTINEAAETTGWSPRMLRYIERQGLIEPPRTDGGYRLYGAAELQRLRTLRELLAQHDIGLGDVGFALRLRRDAELRDAVETWFEATPRAARADPGQRLAALGAGEASEAAGRRRAAATNHSRRPPR